MNCCSLGCVFRLSVSLFATIWLSAGCSAAPAGFGSAKSLQSSGTGPTSYRTESPPPSPLAESVKAAATADTADTADAVTKVSLPAENQSVALDSAPKLESALDLDLPVFQESMVVAQLNEQHLDGAQINDSAVDPHLSGDLFDALLETSAEGSSQIFPTQTAQPDITLAPPPPGDVVASTPSPTPAPASPPPSSLTSGTAMKACMAEWVKSGLLESAASIYEEVVVKVNLTSQSNGNKVFSDMQATEKPRYLVVTLSAPDQNVNGAWAELGNPKGWYCFYFESKNANGFEFRKSDSAKLHVLTMQFQNANGFSTVPLP